MPETKDLVLRKAEMRDCESIYNNLWRHAESAKYMLWDVTTSKKDAIARMERTLAYQAAHDYHWFVIEKRSGQAIGFAGLEVRSPEVCGETGVAIGPAFIGKGYGKQILTALTSFAREELGAKTFMACCRSNNTASRNTQLSCGFRYTHSESMTDPRSGETYTMEYYEKDLE